MGEKEGSVKVQDKYETTIRKLFYVLLFLFFIWVGYIFTVRWDGDLFDLINPILNGMVTIFLVIGSFSLIFHRKYGKFNTMKVIEVVIGISLVLTFLTMIGGYSLYSPFLLPVFKENISRLGYFIMPVVTFFVLFLSYMSGFILLLLQSFGLGSLLMIFQRSHFNNIIEDIKEMAKVNEKERDFWSGVHHGFLRWIFNIPKVLDTSEIAIERKVIKEKFSWKNFGQAFFLESILAVVFAIYISLNPLLLAQRSLSELFALASAVSYFIHIIVIPLFIFKKLKVKIPGPATDFFLFEGARSRLMGLILALGTLVLFLRLALRTFDPEILLISFLFYFAGFIMNTFFITFVYFNYFEELLAENILDDDP